MKVYLDDCRDTPEGWVRTYTVEETIELLQKESVSHLSLDNDLGEGMLEGYKVLDWLEEQKHENPDFAIPIVSVHSANPVRRDYMNKLIYKLSQT